MSLNDASGDLEWLVRFVMDKDLLLSYVLLMPELWDIYECFLAPLPYEPF